MNYVLVAFVATTMMVVGHTAWSEGYLARRPEVLPSLRIGIGEDGWGVEPKEYRLQTGKGYRLKVESTGKIECVLDMREFLDNVWVRQIKAGEVEFLNPVIAYVELDDEGEFELTFVPIRPGEYAFSCRGLADQGLIGKIMIE